MVVAFILEGLFVEVGEVPVPGEEETVVVNVEGVVDVCAGDLVLDGDLLSGWGGERNFTLTLQSHRGDLVLPGIDRWGGQPDVLVGTRLRRCSRSFPGCSSHPWGC